MKFTEKFYRRILFDRETMRVYDWWREIFNYGNYGILDELNSFPPLVATGIPRFRGEFFLRYNRSEWKCLRATDRVFEEEVGLEIPIFIRQKIFSRIQSIFIRNIRNFQIFPTFLIKFISRIRL